MKTVTMTQLMTLITALIGLAGCATVKELQPLKENDDPSSSLVFAYQFKPELLFAQQHGCYLYLQSITTGDSYSVHINPGSGVVNVKALPGAYRATLFHCSSNEEWMGSDSRWLGSDQILIQDGHVNLAGVFEITITSSKQFTIEPIWNSNAEKNLKGVVSKISKDYQTRVAATQNGKNVNTQGSRLFMSLGMRVRILRTSNSREVGDTPLNDVLDHLGYCMNSERLMQTVHFGKLEWRAIISKSKLTKINKTIDQNTLSDAGIKCLESKLESLPAEIPELPSGFELMVEI